MFETRLHLRVTPKVLLHCSAFAILATACDPDPGDGGSDTGGTTEPPTASLRVATWNTALMTLTFNSLVPVPPPLPSSISFNIFAEKFNESYESRANAIADGILATDQDVIALNEVFSDEAREILVDRLSGTYPYYVAKIRAYAPSDPGGALPDWLPLPPLPSDDYLVDPLDSGLMVFSRFPFVPLNNAINDADCLGAACEYWGEGGNSPFGLNSDDFAFVTYEACSDFDCFASKGVGLVQVDAPQGETYVAFTHMQADTSVTYSADRGEQYEQIEEFLTEVIGPNDLIDARVILTGDLNTPGGTLEWQDTYFPGLSPGFFACGNNGPCSGSTVLTDAWGFETSVNDPGHTQGGNRLDYMLHNFQDGQLCMQHVMIGYDAADNGIDFHSDHKLVRADFNEAAQWCSPNVAAWDPDQRPLDLEFGEEACDFDAATSAPDCDQDEIINPGAGAMITHPGSYQWFRIEQAGSYVMTTIDADVDVDVAFDVYDSRDLSRPISAVDEDAVLPSPDGAPLTGQQYSLPSPPYYIRTYATANGVPDRTASGIPYTFLAHQNLCRSPTDACVIEPNAVEDYQWPDQSNSTLGVADVWFKFRTSGVKDGALWPGDGNQSDPPRFPTETFIQEASTASSGCVLPPTLEEYSDDGQFTFVQSLPWADVQGGGPFDDLDGDGLLDGSYTAPELPGDTFGELKFYYAHLSRSCPGQVVSFLEQRTTLTYLEPHKVTGLLQYDDSGIGEDDHIRFQFTFDADEAGSSPPCETSCQHAFVFDEPDLPHQSADYTYLDGIPGMSGYYVDWFYPNLFEDEDGADYLLDIDNYSRNGATLDWYLGGLFPLPQEIGAASGVIYVTDTGNLDSADYWYEIEYEQRRRR